MKFPDVGIPSHLVCHGTKNTVNGLLNGIYSLVHSLSMVLGPLMFVYHIRDVLDIMDSAQNNHLFRQRMP